MQPPRTGSNASSSDAVTPLPAPACSASCPQRACPSGEPSGEFAGEPAGHHHHPTAHPGTHRGDPSHGQQTTHHHAHADRAAAPHHPRQWRATAGRADAPGRRSGRPDLQTNGGKARLAVEEGDEHHLQRFRLGLVEMDAGGAYFLTFVYGKDWLVDKEGKPARKSDRVRVKTGDKAVWVEGTSTPASLRAATRLRKPGPAAKKVVNVPSTTPPRPPQPGPRGAGAGMLARVMQVTGTLARLAVASRHRPTAPWLCRSPPHLPRRCLQRRRLPPQQSRLDHRADCHRACPAAALPGAHGRGRAGLTRPRPSPPITTRTHTMDLQTTHTAQSANPPATDEDGRPPLI